MPVEVVLTEEQGGERWTRSFAGRRFSSFQQPGTGWNERLLVERFGVRPPTAPAMQVWGIRVGFLVDPSGVLWHVAEPPTE